MDGNEKGAHSYSMKLPQESNDSCFYKISVLLTLEQFGNAYLQETESEYYVVNKQVSVKVLVIGINKYSLEKWIQAQVSYFYVFEPTIADCR